MRFTIRLLKNTCISFQSFSLRDFHALRVHVPFVIFFICINHYRRVRPGSESHTQLFSPFLASRVITEGRSASSSAKITREISQASSGYICQLYSTLTNYYYCCCDTLTKLCVLNSIHKHKSTKPMSQSPKQASHLFPTAR
jgi:hypothetical protein